MKNLLLLFTVFLFSKICYSQPGELDSSFGKNGITKSDFGVIYQYISTAQQVLEAPDGTLYTLREQGGQTFITKRDKNGKVVDDYGTKGNSRALNLSANKGFIQPDGKIVIAGLTNANNSRDFIITRTNTDGDPDNSFSEDGLQTTKFETPSYATALALQSDGKIVVVGYTTSIDENGESNSDFALVRYDANGSIDTSFGDNGKMVTIKSATDDIPNTITIQSNGKIIVAGASTTSSPSEHNSYSLIIRYNEDGSIDSSFTVDIEKFGYLFSSANAVTIQEDGKIVVVGQSISSTGADNENTTTDIFVTRYKTNGQLDSTFNHQGWITTNFGYNIETAFAVVIYSNGKIGVGCNIYNGNNTDFALARYNANGSQDRSFGDKGLQRVDFNNGEETATLFAIHKEGSIVMAGSTNYYNLAIAHLNYNGKLDASFNGSGKLSVSYNTNNQGSTHFNSTAIQNDGKIVVAGNTWNGNNTDFLVARYNVNGTPDSTFSYKGWTTSDLSVFAEGVNSIAIQRDGKIVAGGQSSDQSGVRFALARYNTNGTLDSTFSTNGIQKNKPNWFGQINSIVLQPDGKILAAGNVWNGRNNDVAVARFNIDGTLDSAFGTDGKIQTDLENSEEVGKSIAIQGDGKIVVAGSYFNFSNTDFIVIRYDASGMLDASFHNNGILTINAGGNDDASAVALQADGKIVIAGSTYLTQGDNLNTNMAVARLNTDGTPDNSFNTDGIAVTDLGNIELANAIAIEKNQKIVVGGSSNSRFAFVRYTTDGGLDTTFSQNNISKVSSKGTGAIENSVSGIGIYDNKLYAVGNGKYPGDLGVLVKYQLDEGTRKPIVRITTPTNNTSYAATAKIKINVSATDPDGTVTKVDFYNGTTLLHTEMVIPYGYTWNNVPAGNYILTAKATDNSGQVSTSDAVKISVIPHKAPTVSITNPANYQSFTGPTTIHLSAAANDPEGIISKVEFYDGDTLLRTEKLFPYTFTWKDVPVGKYKITAKATNNFGLVTTSAVAHIVVVPNKAPTVSITNLANYQRFTAPAAISLIASAKDPDGTISQVQFYNGAALLNTQYSSPYNCTWKDVPAGTYIVTAKAIDNLGLSKTSAPVVIVVTEPNTPIVSSRKLFSDAITRANTDATIKVWPNPASDIIYINSLGFQQNRNTIISVISASGVAMKVSQSSVLNQTIQLDVSSLLSGVYTIKVICGDKILYKLFVKL